MVTAIDNSNWTKRQFDLIDTLRAAVEDSLPPRTQKVIAAGVRDIWSTLIKTEGIPKVAVPKRIHEAQLHLKTGLQSESTYEQRIDELAKRATSILASKVTPEEKFVLARECIPEQPVGEFHLGGIHVSYWDGLYYFLGGALVLTCHAVDGNVVATMWLEKACEQLGHKKPFKLNVFTRRGDKWNSNIPVLVTPKDNLVLLESFLGETSGQGHHFRGPPGSIMGTGLRAVRALEYIAQTVLRGDVRTAACRLIMLMDYPELRKGTDHPLASRGLERAPNMHGAFPHEDAIYVGKDLKPEHAKRLLREIEMPLFT